MNIVIVTVVCVVGFGIVLMVIGVVADSVILVVLMIISARAITLVAQRKFAMRVATIDLQRGTTSKCA